MSFGSTEIIILLLLPLALMIGIGIFFFLMFGMKGKLAGAVLSRMADPYCSFCGRPERESQKMVRGQMAFICAECVTHLNRQIEDERQSSEANPDSQTI
ncbi:MAG: ClpX C4-type zinc finger protein [Acidobacteriota bacterium]